MAKKYSIMPARKLGTGSYVPSLSRRPMRNLILAKVMSDSSLLNSLRWSGSEI